MATILGWWRAVEISKVGTVTGVSDAGPWSVILSFTAPSARQQRKSSPGARSPWTETKNKKLLKKMYG